MNVHFTDDQLRRMGYVAWRQLDDGTWIGIVPMTFGKGRLCYDLGPAGYDHGYCYESLAGAIEGMTSFDPATMAEPFGWFRDLNNGRRRPGGDPAQEYIQF